MERVFELFDLYPMIPVCGLVFIFVLIYRNFKRKGAALQTERAVSGPARQGGKILSDVLYRWSPRDPFTIRDLVRSVAIFGATGSGKTSGSGYQIAKALVSHTDGKRREYGGPIGGLILASKPEDKEYWQKIFRQAGRINDLVIFDAKSQWRFNFINAVQESGGDTRDITDVIMVIGETLEQGDNANRDKFWTGQTRRMIHNAVEIVRLAKGSVTAPDLQEFIALAAQKPDVLNTPEFKKSFHYECLKVAHAKVKTEIETHDFNLAFQYWKDEYPSMADKTRSSIQVGVMGILSVFNTGIVRELVSTTTNVWPFVMNWGVWVLVDMPISSYGAAGAFIQTGFKYLTQRHILQRHMTDDASIIVIHCDEYQKVVNSADPPFLAECRSHGGCMIVLTQSIHALYTRLREGGEHEADSLMTQFGHKIVHAVGDDKTAAYASSLIGKRLQMQVNTSMSPQNDVYESLFGEQQVSSSTSQSIENVLEHREFMSGLRTGGEENGLIVDGIVVRSGQPFSTGENYLKVSFSQK